MKKEIFDLIQDDMFAITFNMNDTFYYACSDSCTIDIDDLEDLEPVIEAHKYWALVAYEAIKRGHDPQISRKVTEEFNAAKKMILDMMNSGNKYAPFYDLKWVQDIKPREIKERKKISKLKERFKGFFMVIGLITVIGVLIWAIDEAFL